MTHRGVFFCYLVIFPVTFPPSCESWSHIEGAKCTGIWNVKQKKRGDWIIMHFFVIVLIIIHAVPLHTS